MSRSRLIELSYYDPKAEVRLTAYADTLVLDEGPQTNTMTAIRFGGYPEMVNAMAAAIHGGAVIDATIKDESIRFQCIHKGYTKQLSHDGVYATATLMANDEAQEAINTEEQKDKDTPEQPRTCYIFCPAGDRDRLFEELDRKTAAPLIPEFREQILDALIADGSLRRMKVYALKSSMEAWALSLKPEDKNIVEVLERGLKDGNIRIPGADLSNIADRVEFPTSHKFMGAMIYSEAEVNLLLNKAKEAGEPIRAAITLAVCYGMRRSEVLGLRWKDIDFERETLTVCNTVVQNGELRIEEERTKTARSHRSIGLLPVTVPYLKELKEKQAAANLKTDKAVAWMNGQEVRPDFIYRKTRQLMKQCGLPVIRFHDLRHTAASMYAPKLSANQLQEFLGHEDISTTLGIYTHVLDNQKRETTATINSVLSNLSIM